jgi:hypothetical protein
MVVNSLRLHERLLSSRAFSANNVQLIGSFAVESPTMTYLPRPNLDIPGSIDADLPPCSEPHKVSLADKAEVQPLAALIRRGVEVIISLL